MQRCAAKIGVWAKGQIWMADYWSEAKINIELRIHQELHQLKLLLQIQRKSYHPRLQLIKHTREF
jgi:hypothetical protein